MKKIVVKTVRYQCSVCQARYGSKKTAARCEARALEKKTFYVGSKVTNKEPRTCSMRGGPYRFKGVVVKIRGPVAADYEYETKWLGGKRVDSHVFQYEVKFTCPHCKEKRTEMYYGPELNKL